MKHLANLLSAGCRWGFQKPVCVGGGGGTTIDHIVNRHSPSKNNLFFKMHPLHLQTRHVQVPATSFQMLLTYYLNKTVGTSIQAGRSRRVLGTSASTDTKHS